MLHAKVREQIQDTRGNKKKKDKTKMSNKFLYPLLETKQYYLENLTKINMKINKNISKS